jgi:hypothetical protein
VYGITKSPVEGEGPTYSSLLEPSSVLDVGHSAGGSTAKDSRTG